MQRGLAGSHDSSIAGGETCRAFGRWHDYTPDFVIRHAKGQAPQTREGHEAVALERWEDLNPDRLAYRVLFADAALPDAGKREVKDVLLGG